MATSLYFHATNSGVANLPTDEQSSLTPDSNHADATSVNRSMDTSVGSSPTSLAITTTADQNAHNYYFGRFCTLPLKDITSITAQTWTYKFAASESNTSANFPCSGTNKSVRVVAYVWRPGTGKLGNIIDGTTAATVDESTAGTETYHVVTFSGSAVNSVLDGDVICFEVWFVITQASSTAYTDTFYYDGTTESAENATVTTPASLISTPQDLTFGYRASQSYTHKYKITQLVAIGKPCVALDGINGNIDCGNQATLWSKSLTKFSISLWIYCDEIGLSTRTLVQHGYSSNQSFLLHRDNGNGDIVHLRLRSAAGADTVGNVNVASATGVSMLKRWTHLVGTYDNSLGSGNILVYADKIKTGGTPGNFTEAINLSATLTIDGSVAGWQKGKVRDFRFWSNKALTQTEINNIYANNDLAPTPDYWLKMQEGTSNPVDTISGSLTGSLTGGATWSTGDLPFTFKYNIKQLVNQSYTHKYNIRQLATQTFSHIYKIRQLINKTFTHKYNIKQLVNQSYTHKYKIRQLVNQSYTHIYKIRQLINQTFTHKYNVKQLVNQTYTHIYNILVSFVTVNQTFTHIYNVKQLVNQSYTHKYKIRQLVSQTFTHKYKIRQLVNQTFTHKYKIRQLIAQTFTHKYNIRQLINNTFTHKFNIKQIVPERLCYYHPAYIYPNWWIGIPYNWTPFVTTANANPNTLIFLVLNVNSGPDTSVNTDYSDHGIPYLKSATNKNIKLLGYVSTFYGATSIITVKDHIQKWYDFYGEANIDGIMLDEMEDDTGDEAYYTEVTAYVKSISPRAIVVGNPGKNVAESYINTVDKLIVWENNGSLPSESTIQTNTFYPTYHRNKFLINAYNISQSSALDTTYLNTIKKYVMAVGYTDDVTPNPYDTVPSYFDDIVALIVVLGSYTHKYKIRQLASQTFTHKYKIRQLVNQTYTHIYNIFGAVFAVNRVFTHKYNVRQLSTQTYTHKYKIRQLVSNAFTHKYKIKQLVNNAFTHKYKIRQLASRTFTHKYNIIAVLIAVSQTFTHKYNIIQHVSQDYTHKYNIRKSVSRSFTHKYNIRKLVARTFTHKYNIKELVSQIFTHEYKIRQSISQLFTHKYNIIQFVSRVFTHKYNIRLLLDTTNTDTSLLITQWLQDSWTEDPYSTVDHYLIPPKSKVTFGRRFDLTSGSHSDVHIHVRSINENPDFVSTDDTIQDNEDVVNIYVEVRYIPEAPLFSSDSPAPPSRMMWHIRSYIDELIRSNPEQLSGMGIDTITHVQQIPDANTFPDIHGQSAIEQLYTIVFTVKIYYAFRVGRVS